MTFEQAILAALTAAIAALWLWFRVDHSRLSRQFEAAQADLNERFEQEVKTLTERADTCEADRKAMREEFGRLLQDSALLQHCPHEACPMRPRAPRISPEARKA